MRPPCLFTLAVLFYGMRREGRAWVEGSEDDMGLLLISTGGKVEPSEGSGDLAVFHFINRIL